jgi:hypothetical protein
MSADQLGKGIFLPSPQRTEQFLFIGPSRHPGRRIHAGKLSGSRGVWQF